MGQNYLLLDHSAGFLGLTRGRIVRSRSSSWASLSTQAGSPYGRKNRKRGRESEQEKGTGVDFRNGSYKGVGNDFRFAWRKSPSVGICFVRHGGHDT